MTLNPRRRHIGVDVDGVLANFAPAFAALCCDWTGKAVSGVPDCWDWYIKQGVTRDQEASIWRHIEANPMFWHSLEPAPGAVETLAVLEALSADHSIYFMTKRPANAKFWTELWLGDHGVSTPTVLVSDQKGKLSSALGIDTFIDDKPENCLEVFRALPYEARVYLYAQPWNLPQQQEWGALNDTDGIGVRVVSTLPEFIERAGICTTLR